MQRMMLLCSVSLALAAAPGCTVGDEPYDGQDTSAVTKLPPSSNPYTLFESLQTRPLALSPNGKLLFATNTPDNRLEIFAVKGDNLLRLGSVSVGLEPI